LKNLFILFLSIHVSSVFALGGQGPIELGKDGLKNSKPQVLGKIGIDEKLGDSLDLNIPFTDDHGKEIVLGKYFGTEKPVFLMLIYYSCPTLCNTHLNQMMNTFRDSGMKIGKDYEFVAVSIDPDESYKLAAAKKESYLKEFGDESTRDGWHFLTGTQESIDKIASQVGFKYAWDAAQRQWAHAAAAYVVTPSGQLSYYHYGVNIQPKVLRLSLVEAADSKIGTVMDRIVLFCLQYDPDKKTYAFYAYNIMKVGALLMAIFLFIFLFTFWRKENRKQI
jgi:protein SCO1/2